MWACPNCGSPMSEHPPSPSKRDLEDWSRAVRADIGIRALDIMLRDLATLVRPGDSLPYAHVWTMIVRPLLSRLTGRDRPRRLTAHPEADDWLRTDEAYNVLTRVVIFRVYCLDPAGPSGLVARGGDDS